MRRHPALRKSSHRARRFAPKGILVEGSISVRLGWVEGRSREDDADELRDETSEHDERRLLLTLSRQARKKLTRTQALRFELEMRGGSLLGELRRCTPINHAFDELIESLSSATLRDRRRSQG
jgi:hypothetical protein